MIFYQQINSEKCNSNSVPQSIDINYHWSSSLRLYVEFCQPWQTLRGSGNRRPYKQDWVFLVCYQENFTTRRLLPPEEVVTMYSIKIPHWNIGQRLWVGAFNFNRNVLFPNLRNYTDWNFSYLTVFLWKRAMRNQGKDEFTELLLLLSMTQRAADSDFDSTRVWLHSPVHTTLCCH